ncbi:Rho GTPase activation protein, partial [Phycomyces blakesleeanus]
KDLNNIQTIKKEYLDEVEARRKAEALLEKLKSSTLCTQLLPTFDGDKYAELMGSEIDCLCKAKHGLEQACNTLRSQRDNMMSEIEESFVKAQATSTKPKDVPANWDILEEAYKSRLKSIRSDISCAKESYDKLVTARDSIINEMVMINTKNAELTAMNNELSMRMDRREKEAVAFIASTSFLKTDSSDNIYQSTKSKSQDSTYNINSIALGPSNKSKQERSVPNSTAGISPESNKLFKFKRTKDAVLGIFGGSDSNTKFYPPKMAEEERDHMSSDSSRDFSKPSDTALSQTRGNSSQASLSIKGHYFKPSKSRRPIKCEVCGDKMWGGTELKFSDCNAVCHSKCLTSFSRACGNESASHDPTRDEKTIQKGIMFGNSLIKQIQIEGGMIPLLVQACVEAVEERGMRFEGIYRKSGGAAQIRSIQDAFDQDNSLNLCNENDWEDVCAVTSVLKQYFRSLPQPLFTEELYAKFISSMDLQDERETLERLKYLLKALPIENYDTIQYLLLHLDRVQQMSKYNLMTIKNIAVVFGPTLMQNMAEGYSMEDTGAKIQIVQFLLQNVHSLFEPNVRLPSIRKRSSRPQSSSLFQGLDRKQL